MGAAHHNRPPLVRSRSNVMHIRNVIHIPEEQLAIGDLISSEGSSGVVHKGVWSPEGPEGAKEVAIKMIKAPGERGTLQYNSAVQLFENEIDVFNRASVCGQQICKLYGVSELSDGSTMCCVMKLYGLNLAQTLKERGKPFALEQIYAFAVDCLRSLAALHGAGIIIVDFKPANVLLDEAGRAVVADFDMAADVGHQDGVANVNVSTGTPAYSSPEAWEPDNFGGVTVKTDIWSFACFMVELGAGKEPWAGLRWPAIRRSILRDCKHPDIPDLFPDAVKQLLKRCFAIMPESRPHAGEILEELQRLCPPSAALEDLSIRSQEP